MAVLEYKSGLVLYRRYLETVQQKPVLRAGLYLVLSLVLIIVLIITALRPTLVTIASLLGDIKQQGSTEKRLDTKIAQLTTAQQTLSQNQDRLEILDQAIPNGDKFASWADRLSGLASQSGVQITQVSMDDKFAFSITTTGEYLQLRQFVERLENLRRLAVVNNVQLVKTTELQMTVKGVLQVYEEKQN